MSKNDNIVDLNDWLVYVQGYYYTFSKTLVATYVLP